MVCPSPPQSKEYEIHIYSEEWYHNTLNGSKQYLPRTLHPYFLIEFINEDSRKPATFQWLEISKPRSLLLQEMHLDLSEIRQYFPSSLSSISSTTHNMTSSTISMSRPIDWDCRYRCPELNACISSNLWCNGHRNCPSGFDEIPINCGGLNKQFFDLFPQEFYSTTTIITCIAISLAIVLFSILILLVYFCCWSTGAGHRKQFATTETISDKSSNPKSKSFDLSQRTSTKSFTTDELFFDRVSTVSSS